MSEFDLPPENFSDISHKFVQMLMSLKLIV